MATTVAKHWLEKVTSSFSQSLVNNFQQNTDGYDRESRMSDVSWYDNETHWKNILFPFYCHLMVVIFKLLDPSCGMRMPHQRGIHAFFDVFADLLPSMKPLCGRRYLMNIGPLFLQLMMTVVQVTLLQGWASEIFSCLVMSHTVLRLSHSLPVHSVCVTAAHIVLPLGWSDSHFMSPQAKYIFWLNWIAR